MELVETLIFWIFAAIAVVAALGVVFQRSVIVAALCLIAAFMGVAGLFVLNNADFLAVTQVLVYGVGLTIVLLFGIMCTGDRDPQVTGTSEASRRLLGRTALGFLTAGLLVGVLLSAARFAFAVQPLPPGLIARLQAEGSTAMLGELLMTRYALPFELASVLLLAAMIGAIVVARKPLGERAPETTASVKYALEGSRLADDAASAYARATFLQKAGDDVLSSASPPASPPMAGTPS